MELKVTLHIPEHVGEVRLSKNYKRGVVDFHLISSCDNSEIQFSLPYASVSDIFIFETVFGNACNGLKNLINNEKEF